MTGWCCRGTETGIAGALVSGMSTGAGQRTTARAPLVARLLAAGRDPSTIVAERAGFRVHQASGLRWLYGGGDAIQSVMSLTTPERPLLPATIQLLGALLWRPAPATALNLGIGGGAIERFVARYLPSLRLWSVERSQDAVVLATEHFALPPSGELVRASAEDFVATDRRRYDLVWCDLFDGERQAACLGDGAFLAALCRRLARYGVLAMNLSPRDEAELLQTLMHLRKTLPWVALSVRSDGGNVVVMASRRALPTEEALLARAAQLAEGSMPEFAAVAGALVRLPRPADP